METNVNGFTFFSTFDSGNLASVEAIPNDLHPLSGLPDVTEIPPDKGSPLTPSDYSFRLWTRPDCSGTEYENGNRTWFYFGVKGHGLHNGEGNDHEETMPTLRFTVMNLNKQSKLFSQGMAPIIQVIPLPHTIHAFGKDKSGLRQSYSQQWERIRDKPTYWTINNEKSASNFVMSFRVKCDPKATSYVAFTYPYSYRELQMYLSKLERKYANDKVESLDAEKLQASHHKIYFHRELVIRSLLNFRIDLLTITDTSGISDEREATLDNLFPDHPHTLRPRVFKNKKVVFLSARVHPGETQSSFVINGFLKFLLRDNDSRAEALRKKYVFKLIPMLNPDGVVHGHYRTDSQGVNLNRVYSNPSLKLHPPIYAARKLILYAHHRQEVLDNKEQPEPNCFLLPNEESEIATKDLEASYPDLPKIDFKASSSLPMASSVGSSSANVSAATPPSHWLRSSSCSSQPSTSSLLSPFVTSKSGSWYEMTDTSRFSEGDESIADFSVFDKTSRNDVNDQTTLSFVGAFSSPAASANATNAETKPAISSSSEPKLNVVGIENNPTCKPTMQSQDASASNGSSSTFSEVPTEEDANLDFPAVEGKKIVPTKNSGLFLYVDIHGHASKRGIFMYGNHFPDLEHQVSCMLLPKLMSINCAHFDFPACVFTEKFMHMKDRHTGEGREGSGRVSAFKATGLLSSYTLECNFNTGRLVNGIPMASRDCGRATPPLQFDHPPKYDPEVYEDSGKALAISILDLTEANPWTRLTCSAHKNLRGVRDWLRKFIKAKAAEEAEKLKNATNTPTKTSAASPGRSSQKSSNARRVRTFSSSSAISKKKTATSSPKAPPSSPESYRPVSKLPRKNSSDSPTRGRSKMTSGSTPIRSASTSSASASSSGVKRRSSMANGNLLKGRSQSMILHQRRPLTTGSSISIANSSADSRSRPTSPQAKRPPSRVSNEKLSLSKTKHRKGKVEPMASLRLTTSSDTSQEQDDQQQPILPALSSSSPLKKKPLKRIRRPRKASAGIPTPKT